MTTSNIRRAKRTHRPQLAAIGTLFTALAARLTVHRDDPANLSPHLRRDAGADPLEIESKLVKRAPLIRW